MQHTITRSQPTLLSLSEALHLVLEHAQTLGSEACLLHASVGRVASEDVVATMTLPPFDNSAMDGYALRSEDARQATAEHPVVLPIVGESAAGHPFPRAVQLGEAIKIMTGAVVPAGADTVVMLEEARWRDAQVQLVRPSPPGQHIRRAGEDIVAGQRILRRGERMAWQHLGLLAGAGIARLNVYRPPQVAVLATGSELVPVGASLGPGQIRNCNSLLLTALLRQRHIPHYDFGIVSDDYETLLARLREGLSADLLLISGGVSVGEHDLVKKALRAVGFEQIFWRVNMKPGKPQLFGRVGHTYVFGLPGNPVSCVVGFLAFIAPWIRQTLGDPAPAPQRIQALLTRDVTVRDEKTHLVTAHLEGIMGDLRVTPTSQQGSGMLTSLATADCFILLPEGPPRIVRQGERVEVMPFDW